MKYEVCDMDEKEEREKAIDKLRELNLGYLVGICQPKKRDTRPDFVAFKDGKPLIIEVASRKSNRLVRQLEYDQMAGETLLVLPITIKNLKIWDLAKVYNIGQNKH